jgi:hypothetical protein
MVRECGVEGAVLRVPVANGQEAASMRGQWFAYCGALKAEARRIGERGPPYSIGDQDQLELAKIAPMVMIEIQQRDGEFALVWQNRENSWQAQRLRQMQRLDAAPPAMTSELDNIAARLMQTQKEKEDGKA